MSKFLPEVVAAFLPDFDVIHFDELGSGHINDTFLVKTDQGQSFVVQKINKKVFKDVPGLVRNKSLVSLFLHEKMSALSYKDRIRRVLTFVPTSNGDYHYTDTNGDYWNVMIYIKDSQTFEIVEQRDIAYEGGKLFGAFLNLTEDFDATELIEVIPQFHDMSFRFEQFKEALSKALPDRVDASFSLIQSVESLKEEMHILQNLKEEGKIKLRVTHNDTKISNALFD
ncbi:MAG: aminoglycoside phosphotransferase family protein, partial [Lutimonas sp.]